MFIIEYIIEKIAPHDCLGCGARGSLLCTNCRELLPPVVSRCYRCHKSSELGRTCRNCRAGSKLYAARSVTSYDWPAKELVWRLKFKQARAAGEEIGQMVAALLDASPGTVLTHIPTAPSRIRQRGYDQARLIAKTASLKTGLPYKCLLVRESSSQQHGAGRRVRYAQAKDMFTANRQADITGQHIILIDDVITTGATLEAAALALKNAGAKQVEAIVFAQD